MIKLREPREDDLGFIVASWLRSSTDAWNKLRTSPVHEWVNSGLQIGDFVELTHRFTRGTVARILQRETTRVVIACADDDDDVILGFAVGEPRKHALHWVYVKHGDGLGLRGRGVARQMVEHIMPDAGSDGRAVTLTFLPRDFLTMQSRWPLRFDPRG